MKTINFILAFIGCMVLSISCTEEPESVGNVLISVENQSLSNQSDYFVDVGIVFQESDSGLLESFKRSDISEGGMVEFIPITLNAGNYYVRYQYLIGNSFNGVAQHKPFQIQAGEDTVVKIIR